MRFASRRAIQSTRPLSVLATVFVVSMFMARATEAVTTVRCGSTLDAAGEEYVVTSDLNCAGAAVTVTASTVHLDLRGFTIASVDGQGVGVDIGGESCLETANVRIENGRISGFATGVRLCQATGAHLKELTVQGNTTGILLQEADGNRIMDNAITENEGSGVKLVNSDENRFVGNLVTDNLGATLLGGGYFFDHSHGNLIAVSDVSRNGDFGVLLFCSNRNTIRDSLVAQTNRNGSPRHGIVVACNQSGETSAGSVIRNNIANGNLSGIYVLVGAARTSVRKNVAMNNALVGIHLSSGSTHSTVKHNKALYNSLFDLADDLANMVVGCGDNTWKNNTYATAEEACIE